MKNYIYIIPQIKGIYKFNVNINTLLWFKNINCFSILFIPTSNKDLLYFFFKKSFMIDVETIGRGSNIIFQFNLTKIILKLGAKFSYIFIKKKLLYVGCSLLNSYLFNFSYYHSLTNFEFIADIPGSIGGSIFMNAGSFNMDIKKILFYAKAINIKSKKILNLKKKNIVYRSYKINHKILFIESKFFLREERKTYIYNKYKNIKKNKYLAQPKMLRTVGSTFKNIKKKKIWLVLNNCSIGGISCVNIFFSRMHCNFIVNYANVTYEEINFIIQIAKKRAITRYKIEIEEEIKLM